MKSICENFGANVRKYRKQNGYSQERLAEITGLHRTYISAVERGSRSIALDNIDKLASALQIATYKLFVFEDDKTSN